jgi:hypothetical protein
MRRTFGHIPNKRFGHIPQNMFPVLDERKILERYPAHGAWSIRLLTNTYTGSCLRVRRSSDNTEQDIGFNGSGLIDEVALTSFVGAGSGFIRIWYDQSGNGFDLNQATEANQPRIVNAGTIDKQDDYPVIVFDGSNDSLSAGLIITTPPFVLSQVCVPTVGTFNQVSNIIAIADTATTNNAYQFVLINVSTDQPRARVGVQGPTFKTTVPESSNGMNLINIMAVYGEPVSGIFNFYGRALGTKSIIDSAPVQTSIDNFTVGVLTRTTNAFFPGKVSEIITWDTFIGNDVEEIVMQNQIDNFNL